MTSEIRTFLIVVPKGYVNREEVIVDSCRDLTVLHLGCVGATLLPAEERVRFFLSDNSLHSKLARVAKRLVGVDLDDEVLRELVALGCQDLITADVQDLEPSLLPLPTFDVLVAGDLIEHLSNPGAALDSFASLTSPSGKLIISTPNAFGLPNWLRFVLGRFVEGADHVQSYSIYTLGNLLARHRWKIAEALTCHQSHAKEIVGGLLFRVGKAVMSKYPKFGGTLLVYATPIEPA